RTLAACGVALERAQAAAGVTLADVGHIVLVGGSTYVPAVVQKVRTALCGGEGSTVDRARCAAPIREDPDTAVALGAALRAAANGLGVGDDDQRVRLWFRSAGATRREETAISGHVESLDPSRALKGGVITLSTVDGKELGEVALDNGLRFSFTNVALEA